MFGHIVDFMKDPQGSLANWLICDCFKPKVYLPDAPSYSRAQHHLNKGVPKLIYSKIPSSNTMCIDTWNDENYSVIHMLRPGLTRRLRAAYESLSAFNTYIDKFRLQHEEFRI